MEYYHYLIRFIHKGEKRNSFGFNYDKERILKELVEPFNQNKPFLMAGLTIDRSSVNQVLIFQSLECLERDIEFPSGATLYSSTFDEKVSVMLGGILDTLQVTTDFITLLQIRCGNFLMI